ncbi:hypothetical protein BDP27DRAFT_220124 [Rhodocollybia butyracea]|uniref:Uncharacterized protein n=1 Tax=Rhodocollybia butyracea TaxID=206335 RepID=A0A9P5Q5V2_9AGAR|nr:hypothetical protein BDP27DRAFT_220124 [Rhodocollybia butyracea]
MAINNAMGSKASLINYRGLLMPMEGPRKWLFFKMTGPGCDPECFGWMAKGPTIEWKNTDKTSAGYSSEREFQSWYVGISLRGSQEGPFKEPPSNDDVRSFLWKRHKAWTILLGEFKFIKQPEPVEPAYHGPPFIPRLPSSMSLHRHRPYPPFPAPLS